MWASDKLAGCSAWAQAEYAWLYGLADANGSFELSNLRVIWGRVAAVRKSLSLERLEQIFNEFRAKGLLFVWEESGKTYGHWTGSNVPGRLPPPSMRNRFERLAPAVPSEPLAEYVSAYARGIAQSKGERAGASAETLDASRHAQAERSSSEPSLEARLERAQVQEEELEKDLDGELDSELEQGSEAATNSSAPRQDGTLSLFPVCRTAPEETKQSAEINSAYEGRSFAETLAAIYEQERGSAGSALPAMRAMTAQRARRCVALLQNRPADNVDKVLSDFRGAVRRARNTPFLCGENERRWRANFDWFIASEANMQKVLKGKYDAFSASKRESSDPRASRSSLDRRTLSELSVGAGPPGPHRVKPEILERERQRRLQRGLAL